MICFRLFSMLLCIAIFTLTCSSPNASETDFSYIDDSNLSDDKKRQYEEDAAYLSEYHMEQSPLLSKEVFIPDEIFLSFYGGLVAVYNSDNEHTYPIKGVNHYDAIYQNEIGLGVDSTVSWKSNWAEGNIVTGVPEIDSLVAKYDLQLGRLYFWTRLDYFTAVLESREYLNRAGLCSLFVEIKGIKHAYKNSAVVGDGDRISASLNNNTLFMTYSIGWGDCPAGCISRHFWEFNVHKNNVSFIRDYGD
jgi:hypothetical protein